MTFWDRPVHLRDLILVMLLSASIWMLIIGAVLVWLWPGIGFRVDLHDQMLSLRLPQQMTGEGEMQSKIPVRLRFNKVVELPIDQPVSVTINQALPAHVRMNAAVPVQTSVRVKRDVELETELHMRVPIYSWLPPVPARMPVKLTVPVDLEVPVNTVLQFRFDQLAVATLSEPLQVPLKTRFKSLVKVDQQMDVSMLGAVAFSLATPLEALPVKIDRASLSFSLADLGWEWL